MRTLSLIYYFMYIIRRQPEVLLAQIPGILSVKSIKFNLFLTYIFCYIINNGPSDLTLTNLLSYFFNYLSVY